MGSISETPPDGSCVVNSPSLPAEEDALFKKLYAEEMLRNDIREHISQRKTSILAFMNTPFCLFLLSSVLLAGLGKLYYYYENKTKEEAANRQEIRKLAAEYEYRVRMLQDLFVKLRLADPKEHVPIAVLTWRIIVGNKEYTAIIPDFNNVHLLGLIVRMNNLGVVEGADRVKKAALALEFSRSVDWKYNIDEADKELTVLVGYLGSIAKMAN